MTLPFLPLSFPAGVLADRGSRRGLMALAEALRALGFLGAAGTVAYSVAAPALIPALVPRADLARANGRIELARSLAAAAGPALAGLLVAAVVLLAGLADFAPTSARARASCSATRCCARSC